MGKSKIIKELANNEITIDVALKRLLILASDLDDIELKNWAHKELYGYNEHDDLPSYRVICSENLQYTQVFSDPKYPTIKGPLLLNAALSQKTINKIKNYKVLEPISNIFDKTQKNNTVSVDKSFLAKEIYEKTEHRLFCNAVSQEFDISLFTGIINKVNTILLEIFIKLDKEYGNLDDLIIDLAQENKDKIEKTKSEVFQIIYNSCTFNDNSKTVDKSKVQHSNIATDSDNAEQTTREDKRKSKGSIIGGKENKLEKKTDINAKAKFDL